MTDVFTSKKRSEVMSRIRSKSGLDRRVHNWLCGSHIKHEMHPKVKGNPDICLRGGACLCIFLDSCFFHGCPDHYREPKSNVRFWREKIRMNRERDRKRCLLPYPWMRIWEHDVRNGKFKDIIKSLSVKTP